ncbi:MAG: DUF1295 domain-containing protein [Pseudomonadota bacterium]
MRWIIVAYAAAIAVAFGVAAIAEGFGSLWAAALADVAATLVIFAFSVGFRNASFYDAYWSVAPPVLLAFWWWLHGGQDLRMLLMGIVVVAWAVRLTRNWARGWTGLGHEDWRYIDLRAQNGRWYWAVNLFGIHLLPTALVFAGCVPMWIAARSDAAPGWLDWAAFAVGIGAVYLEWLADEQLYQFRRAQPPQERLLDTGVWAWLRHPNYLGEIGFWLALALFGLAAGAGAPWANWPAWLGFVLMLGLFAGITIPMIERRMLARRPGYADYQRRVRALIPTPPVTA